jgi:hypothetical protein
MTTTSRALGSRVGGAANAAGSIVRRSRCRASPDDFRWRIAREYAFFEEIHYHPASHQKIIHHETEAIFFHLPLPQSSPARQLPRRRRTIIMGVIIMEVIIMGATTMGTMVIIMATAIIPESD